MESTPNGKNVQGGVSIPFQEILNLNQEELRAYIDKMILQAVESVLNDMIEAEADEQCGAGRYERNAERRSTRAGHYDRQFTTKAGTVTIHMPKLRDLRFSTAVFERWRRREASLEEAFVEMYLAGVSTRRVGDVVEALMGGSVSASTISRLNQKAYARLEEWRTRPLQGRCPYVYLDGVWGRAMLGDSFEPGFGSGRRRSERRGPAGDHRRGGRMQGGCGKLAKLPPASEGARSGRSPSGSQRQGFGTAEGSRGILSKSPVAALHGALLPQRAFNGAERQGPDGRKHAEGHPCPGKQGRGGKEGQGGCCQASRNEA